MGSFENEGIHEDYDDRVLAIAEPLVVLSRGKLTLNKVLKAIANDISGPLAWTPERGANSDVMVKRLYAKSLADRRKFAGLTKSEISREWNEFVGWLTSAGDAVVKEFVAALYLELCRAINHSE